MPIDLSGRTAIITGAGAGLGRAHALLLARQGANVVVNDIPQSLDKAQAVAAEISAAGGSAIALTASVTDEAAVAAMTAEAIERFGKVDILVNNAGILRDKSFAKITLADWRDVIDVHLTGAYLCTHALWDHMRANNYGRIVMTTSSSGLYGNFGQANYGAAKAGMIGLMNVLHLEGAKTNIRVNVLAPTAATAMTQDLLPPETAALLTPDSVTPGLLFLVSENAPSRVILGAGGGVFAVTHIEETPGVYFQQNERTPETIAARFAEISDRTTAMPQANAFAQTFKFATMAAKGK